MRIFFRADASHAIGNGHVMRCLTLALELKLIGAECCFICREHEGNLNRFIQEQGYLVIGLPSGNSQNSSVNLITNSTYDNWLGENWEMDARQTLEILDSTKADWLIVDHYGIDFRWEAILRRETLRIFAIDDLANRNHDCDLLLDQNFGRKKEDYLKLVSKDCKILVGTDYALIRPDFAAIREKSLERRKNTSSIKQILISMGGVDQNNVTNRVLEVLKTTKLESDIEIVVVMGVNSPCVNEVQSLANKMPIKTEFRINVNNMAELMADCDLAIGAAGSTSWERCCLGLPTIMVVIADNQLNGAIELEKAGCAKIIFSVEEIEYSLPKFVSELMISDKLSNLSSKCSQVTDGLGSKRVLSEMLLH